MANNLKINPTCPIPLKNYPRVTLAHGGGGEMMNRLINDMFVTALDNKLLRQRNDSAVFEIDKKRLAFTTDSYVVSPLFFPGGDIGSLAVTGTVNDLAVAGARPLYLSLGLIIEEGFSMESLWQIVLSIASEAKSCGVDIVTGDTKVVDKGKGDGIYINTSGVGIFEHHQEINPGKIEKGDAIIINGDIGRHGMAIMASRRDLGFRSSIKSDCAVLSDMIMEILSAGVTVHCMRDLTRGGAAAALCELAVAAGAEMEIEESRLLFRDDVDALGEILGIDPIYSACEGRLVIMLPESETKTVLNIMKRHEVGQDAGVVGEVKNDHADGSVILRNRYGTERIITMPSGEQLPRIC